MFLFKLILSSYLISFHLPELYKLVETYGPLTPFRDKIVGKKIPYILYSDLVSPALHFPLCDVSQHCSTNYLQYLVVYFYIFCWHYSFPQLQLTWELQIPCANQICSKSQLSNGEDWVKHWHENLNENWVTFGLKTQISIWQTHCLVLIWFFSHII